MNGVEVFYEHLGLPEASRLNKRIFKKTLREHGQLTSADKKTLSEDVSRLTWKYTLKASTVQVLPYEDTEREYLEVAIIEVALSSRKRAPRIHEMIHRAIPYPVLLVLAEGDDFCVSVAHKRFSRAEKGSIVAEAVLASPWIEQPLADLDRALCHALALKHLSQVDFYALYGGMVNAVLARSCAVLTGSFVLDAGHPQEDRRRRLEHCHELRREISGHRAAIHEANQFAERVELNTRIKELEAGLARAKADL
ncbi:DUF4391 domain-containing protein [bacterium AH-315-N03]|nr:DUF4391 domain-containing protein [bacterium AH-315-N03]